MLNASWLILAVGFILVIGLAVVVMRRRGKFVSYPSARPFALVVTRFGAVAYAIIALLTTIVVVIETLASQFVQLALPVRTFWPGAFPWVEITDGPTALVTGGGFTSADVTVSGLHTDARLPLAAGHAIQGLTVVVVAAVIAFLCHRLLAGQPFKPILARSVTVAAAAVGIGGIAWQVFFQIGGLVSSQQVLGVSGWSSEEISFAGFNPDNPAFDPLSTGLPEPSMGFALDFWPIFLALSLLAVAVAFRYSARLQRDTEGLV